MRGGVGQSGNFTRGYWIDSSVSAAWKDIAASGIKAWSNTGSSGCGVYTSVWFTENSKANSVIDVYNRYVDIDAYGCALFFAVAGDYNSGYEAYLLNYRKDWVWTQILIDESFCNYDLTYSQKLSVFEHEVGHTFGLAHVENRNLLMHPYGNECLATRPTADECNGVNYLYGGYNP